MNTININGRDYYEAANGSLIDVTEDVKKYETECMKKVMESLNEYVTVNLVSEDESKEDILPFNWESKNCWTMKPMTSEELNTIVKVGNINAYSSEEIREGLDKNNSAVDHPSHYAEGRLYEPVDVIWDWELDFCLGNAVKYISRAGRKDPDKTIEDLEKARWYIEKEIQYLEGKPE